MFTTQQKTSRRRANYEAGFSLIESVVAAALLVIATTGALLVLMGTARVSGQILERSRLTTLVDNLLTDIKTSANYAGATNIQLLQGDLPQQFLVNDEQISYSCALQRTSPQSPWLLVKCTNTHGSSIQRIVRIPTGVPVPNSFVTAAP